MKDAEQIECWHDTNRGLMYHVIGSRVTIITNRHAGIIKFYKDDKKYNEISADISVIEFERILDRTIKEAEQLDKINKVK